MTYMQFHFVFTFSVVAVLVFWMRQELRKNLGKFLPALLFLVAMALIYTTPWDNYLVYKQVWSYPKDRVLFTIGYVPIEEYMFFVLQTVITALWTFWLYQRGSFQLGVPRRRGPRWVGSALAIGLAVWGGFCLMSEATFYLGLILAWALPVVALHWAYGGDWLWQMRWILALAIVLPSVYLSVADRIAIELGIWLISERYTTGISILGLPVEEALFFTVANVLVAQGGLVYWATYDQLNAGEIQLPASMSWLFRQTRPVERIL